MAPVMNVPTEAELNHDLFSEQISCLEEQGFTTSLARLVQQQVTLVFASRIWVVDNSTSMRERDGKRLIPTPSPSTVRWEACSRWEELTECVLYHAQLAALFQAPTEFKLLNAPGGNLPRLCCVGEMGPDMIDEELLSLQNTLLNTTPGGATPLARQVEQMYEQISKLAPTLHRQGQKVAVVLATDGLPTDEAGYGGRNAEQQLETALQKLLSLPVWMVVRLCTNQDHVISYYQSLDDRLEWNLEVLDDFCAEAKEVYSYNPWLNYCLPLHRCREMGCQHRLLDLLDERALTMDEMVEFMKLLLGESHDDEWMDPHVEWKEFVMQVKTRVARESKPWNPIRQTTIPWIDVRQLERCYGPNRYNSRKIAVWAGLLLLASALSGTCWHKLTDHPPSFVTLSSINQVEGFLSMAVGIAAVAIILGKQPTILWDKRLILAVAMLALAVHLHDKPLEYLRGVAFMIFGIVLFVGTAMYQLSRM